MNVDTYRLLLADLCRELGLAEVASDGERLLVEGTEIALSREVDRQGEHLWICVDFGAVPDPHAHRVYRTMLEANLRAGAPEAGLLTLQPSGHAALLVRHPLTPALPGDLLAEALVCYSAVAKRWVTDICHAGEAPA
jgi:Tir chaperone protein (CesT) family